MDVVLLRGCGDELAVGAPPQRDVAAGPSKAARRRGALAEAPNADAAIVGAGDAAAVLAEVEVGHRAGVWPEFAHLAPLDDVGVLADRRGNCPGRSVLR